LALAIAPWSVTPGNERSRIRPNGDKTVDIDAGAQAHSFQHEHEVFHHDLPVAPGANGQPPRPASNRVTPGVEGRQGVGEPEPSRVVEVRTDPAAA